MTRTSAIAAYLVFLAGFAAFKYLAAAPPEFSSGYAISVAILVILTGVLPYALAVLFASRAGTRGGAWITATLVATIACCAAYAGYWAVFIAPSGADVPMLAVALRGLYAGSLEALLAALFVTSGKERVAAM